MIGAVRAWIRGVVGLVVLVAAAYAGWRWGEPVFTRVHGFLGLDAEEALSATSEGGPSPELASRTMERYQSFLRGGPAGGELAVSEVEATSVLRYGAPGVVPGGVLEPTLDFREGGLRIRARVVRSAFPDFPDMGALAAMLPDTIPMEVDAALMPFEGDETALVVRRVEAGGIPVPRRFLPRLMDALGRKHRAGLPPDAVIVPLPDNIRRAYVLSDSLRLVGAP